MEFNNNNNNEELCVNKRVIDQEGYKGTIKYIGTVASAKNINDIWLGIEWDNHTRGKHDGSCIDSNNIIHRYFQCVNGAGSFIKPNKINLGVSFINALKEKYVSLDAPEIAPDDILPDAYVATAKGILKSIEFVGEKKIRQRQQIHDVKKIALRNMSVSTIGDGVQDLAGHLLEVDLQDNLFYRWDEVIQLASNLPLLNNLLLHGNKIGNITNEFIENNPNTRNCFQSLIILALNSCSITSWSTVINLETILPNIQELYLAVNQFEDINSFPSFHSSQYTQLRILDLSTCGISSWSYVSNSVGLLSNLEELLLDGNPITEILPSEENKFQALKRVSLSGTRISTWNDVNVLDSYPILHHLRLTNIPLFHGKGPSEIRPEIIGRLKKLEIFNGSGISPKERNDSEKQYLRKIIKLKNNDYKDNYDQFIQLFPNYEQLFDKYSNEINLFDSQFNHSNNEVNNIASELIEVTFQNLIFSIGNNNFQPIKKKIPLNISIERIKLLIKQVFDIPPPIQVLSIRNTKNDMPVVMDDDKEILRYYGGIDGAEIFINEKN